jgi:tripartite-type tricarboxylate transporter receptor subunit TctC
MLVKHAFQISVLAITFAITAAVNATAQSYPTRPITIIVPFPPGGNSDLVIRHLADRLSVSLNQPVIVENRAGAPAERSVRGRSRTQIRMATRSCSSLRRRWLPHR